ncbi:hypothetical protein [Sphingorhabdus sp. YGSMI21]|uniref:hypothetical protein n=1 Tax=Sphingorhabdus sp. YGSMI21 TaxID=2077182 RepID=UPI000C1EC482|nr:hypothetical protein [Sphingorhabdus sp. YGSMI21]ATW02260.1 hypothetical protein CHN51_00970 [Sphingorhabdus sp. YGSMI21]
MSKKYLILLAALPLGLSACSKADDGDGSGVSIDFSDDSKSDDEKVKIGGDGEDSKFSIKADGFSMEIDLPSITLDSDDFDMNDVDLYPGSQVTSFDIEDKDGQGGKVRIGFKAPIDVDGLADWYEKQLTDNDFKVTREGTSLSGETDEGDPFALALSGLSGNETKGVLEFSERK